MKKITFLLMLLFIGLATNAQWQQTNGPFKGIIYCFAVSGVNIFAGTNHGIYLSNDNCATWSQVSSLSQVKSIVISGSNIYAGSNGSGVYLSTNNGATWSGINNGNSYNVYSLAISGSNLFAGTSNGVYLTSNNGTSPWSQSNGGRSVYSIKISGSKIFSGTDIGVYLSTNNGTSWSLVNNGLPAGSSVNSIGINGSNIFASVPGSGIYLSNNNGTNWSAINIGLSNLNVSSILISGTSIFAGTAGGVFISNNNGSSWSEANYRLTNLNVSSLGKTSTSIIAGTNSGVYISSNNGNSWTPCSNGLQNTFVNTLVAKEGNVFAGTNVGEYISANSVTSWISIYNEINISNTYSSAVKDSFIFIGTNGGLLRSSDNGANWSLLNNGVPSSRINFIKVKDSNIFLATNSGIFISNNNGNNWSSINNGLTNLTVNSISIKDSNIFAGTDGGVFLSTNKGSNWTPVNNGLTNLSVNTFTINGANIFAGTSGGVFQSINNGVDWIAVNNGLSNTNVYSLVSCGSNIFAATNTGVYMSINNSANWFSFNDGWSNPYINTLLLLNDTLYAGANNGGGVWKHSLLLTPSSIAGITSVCSEQSGLTYSISHIDNATNYIWSVPNGASIITGQGSESITVSFGNNSGNISVIASNSCSSSLPSTLSIIVNPIPLAPTATQTINLCQGAIATQLSAIGSNLLWYTVSTNGTGSSTAPMPSTVNAGTTHYYVSQSVSNCESPRTDITVTVNETPSLPTATTTYTYCQGETATQLTATGSNLLWYTVPTNGTGISTAPTPSTVNAGITHYYVSQSISNCESPRTDIAVTVNSIPLAPTATQTISYCQGETATQLTATGSNLLWYTVPTNGTGNTTAPMPSTVDAGTTHYYVSQSLSNCESPRTDIAVTVNSIPLAPTATPTISYCQGATAIQLTATGNNLLWYTVPTNGTGSSTAPTPSTTNAGTTHYYVSQTVSNCEGPSTDITVTVNATPQTPFITINSLLLHSDAATGNQWYDQSGIVGGATTQDYSPLTEGDYYVIVTVNGCPSAPSNTINVIFTGIEQKISNTGIKVHPNPVSDELIIEAIGNNETINFDIYNSVGQLVFKGSLLNKTVVQTGSFASGVYLIKLNDGRTFEFKKLLKL